MATEVVGSGVDGDDDDDVVVVFVSSVVPVALLHSAVKAVPFVQVGPAVLFDPSTKRTGAHLRHVSTCTMWNYLNGKRT